MNVSINYILKSIASITGGDIIGSPDGTLLENLLLDSRKLVSPASTIFFSIKNSNEKSNAIIKELYDKGVRHFALESIPETSYFKGASFVIVQDTLSALQNLAANYRQQFNIPVIGITGSNGKTIVKEWLYQLLRKDFNIARSPRSYNSQIGVPLSLLQLKIQNTLGIFEAGISEPGEMFNIQKMMQPNIGVFTNIGDAHDEGFNNREEKIKEKLKLFIDVQHLIYCSDYKDIDQCIRSGSTSFKSFTWGIKENALLKIKNVNKENGHTKINSIYNGKNLQVTIPFTDEASVENAIHCWCMLLLLGIGHDIIHQGLLQLHPIEMRLELKQGINNCSIINDSYSADIHSFQIALEFLNQQKQHDSHVVILSDILQSGLDNAQLYAQVANELEAKGIKRFIGIGEELFNHKNIFANIPETHFYYSVNDFKKDFYRLHFHNESILLKGARIFEFEQISFLMEQKIHQTILTIDLTAVAHNLKQYKNLLNPGTRIMAMVKAFSYGSGSFEIARILQYNKVDYLAVAYTDEAVTLRKAGITLPIMIMNPEINTFNTIIQYFLEPEIFSFHLLHSFKNYIQSQGLEQYPIHLKIDTGMHRLGFLKEEINDLGHLLNKSNDLRIQSVFTHLIASNDPGKKDLSLAQFHEFKDCCSSLKDILKYDFIKHIANTSAISNYPDMQMDMVRTGIGMYGLDSNASMHRKLKNVTSLTTTIAQIKNVKANSTIGYGGYLKLQKDSKIATIRIGYADGYHRVFGNGIGKVLINNALVPVIGNICMDMCMVDITETENINEGDKVIIFGSFLPVQKLAEWAGTIPYEIMTNISQRVKRVYIEQKI